jgi:hypothetical protein
MTTPKTSGRRKTAVVHLFREEFLLKKKYKQSNKPHSFPICRLCYIFDCMLPFGSPLHRGYESRLSLARTEGSSAPSSAGSSSVRSSLRAAVRSPSEASLASPGARGGGWGGGQGPGQGGDRFIPRRDASLAEAFALRQDEEDGAQGGAEDNEGACEPSAHV